MNNEEIKKIFIDNDISYSQDITLAPYTTWKIGGKADFLIVSKSKDELIKVVDICNQNNIKFVILGQGSNVLISDLGIKGVVIINRANGIQVLSKSIAKEIQTTKIKPRLEASNFDTLNYIEEKHYDVLVRIDSGTPLPFTINHLLEQGITGLQWFAGIPGTIGGAIYNNIHGGAYYFSEFIQSVSFLDHNDKLQNIHISKLDFDYDKSPFQDSKNTIIDVTLNLNLGDKEKAIQAALAWLKRKREQQPMNSAGCCFKNLSELEKEKAGVPNVGWGYIIDKVLNLKGTRIGDAQISNKHAAFIENIGHASSQNVLDLLNLISNKASQTIGIYPKTEIFFYGFDKKEIAQFL